MKYHNNELGCAAARSNVRPNFLMLTIHPCSTRLQVDAANPRRRCRRHQYQSAMRSREAWSPRAVSGASTVLRSTPERSFRPPRGPRWGMTATTLSDYVNGNFLTGQQLPSAQQRACRWARVRVLGVCACAVAACEGPSVRASCMPCAWRKTLTVGASDAHAHRRVECCAARCARRS